MNKYEVKIDDECVIIQATSVIKDGDDLVFLKDEEAVAGYSMQKIIGWRKLEE